MSFHVTTRLENSLEFVELYGCKGVLCLQIWRVTDVPKGDKYQYTHFAHTVNSFDSAPPRLLASDSRLRPDRYALENGDLSRAGTEKARYFSRLPINSCILQMVIVSEARGR